KIRSAEVAGQFHTGTNVIEARVFNHNGPPALWLALATDQLNLYTDQSWNVSYAGSSWRPARLATTAKAPGPGNWICANASTFGALKNLWPFWIICFAIASAITLVWNIVFKQPTARWHERIPLLVLAVLWLGLFWNNARLSPFHVGFDSAEHLRYIRY